MCHKGADRPNENLESPGGRGGFAKGTCESFCSWAKTLRTLPAEWCGPIPALRLHVTGGGRSINDNLLLLTKQREEDNTISRGCDCGFRPSDTHIFEMRHEKATASASCRCDERDGKGRGSFDRSPVTSKLDVMASYAKSALFRRHSLRAPRAVTSPQFPTSKISRFGRGSKGPDSKTGARAAGGAYKCSSYACEVKWMDGEQNGRFVPGKAAPHACPHH